MNKSSKSKKTTQKSTPKASTTPIPYALPDEPKAQFYGVLRPLRAHLSMDAIGEIMGTAGDRTGAALTEHLLTEGLKKIVETTRMRGRFDGELDAIQKTYGRSGKSKWSEAAGRSVGDLVAGMFCEDCTDSQIVGVGVLEFVTDMLATLAMAEEIDGGIDDEFAKKVRWQLECVARHGAELARRIDVARAHETKQKGAA